MPRRPHHQAPPAHTAGSSCSKSLLSPEKAAALEKERWLPTLTQKPTLDGWPQPEQPDVGLSLKGLQQDPVQTPPERIGLSATENTKLLTGSSVDVGALGANEKPRLKPTTNA